MLLALDVALAQVGKRLMDTWELRAPEQAYRVPSPVYHHGLAPGAAALATWGGIRYPYRTNSLGFRDAGAREVPLRPARGRVLLLGDSFTEGVGVPWEETFAGILARRLAARGIEVLNGAVMSYSPSIYYAKAKELIERRGLEVDAIVAFVDVSDVLDEARFYRLEGDRVVDAGRGREMTAAARARRFVRLNSLLVNVGSRLRLAFERRLAEGEPRSYGLGAEEAAWDVDSAAYRAWGEDGLRRARAGMDRLLGLTRSRGVALQLVVYPWPDHVLRGAARSRYVDAWESWAAQNGVPFTSLFGRFVPAGGPREAIRRWYIPFDFHWNAAGHRHVAEALLDGALEPAIAAAGRGAARRAADAAERPAAGADAVETSGAPRAAAGVAGAAPGG